MKIHDLKTIQPYFDLVNNTRKRFEVRKNDRDFQDGDSLLLKEYSPKSDTYSGKEILCKILYLLDNPNYVKKGYVIMSIGIIKRCGNW